MVSEEGRRRVTMTIKPKKVIFPYKTEWVEDIKEFIIHNRVSSEIRRVGRFICRIIRWIPVLWNQEDWDYEYLYDLIEVKMKELRKDMSKDVWHDQKVVRDGVRQIDICLARLDRWRNWPNYYDYPMDDIYYVPTKNNCKEMHYYSEENEKQRWGALEFEKKNYDKFWKDFLRWHRGWWT